MKLKMFLKKNFVSCVNALALLLVVGTANSACVWILNQPEFPEEANRFKKVTE